jgi:hypothetical protein
MMKTKLFICSVVLSVVMISLPALAEDLKSCKGEDEIISLLAGAASLAVDAGDEALAEEIKTIATSVDVDCPESEQQNEKIGSFDHPQGGSQQILGNCFYTHFIDKLVLCCRYKGWFKCGGW